MNTGRCPPVSTRTVEEPEKKQNGKTPNQNRKIKKDREKKKEVGYRSLTLSRTTPPQTSLTSHPSPNYQQNPGLATQTAIDRIRDLPTAKIWVPPAPRRFDKPRPPALPSLVISYRQPWHKAVKSTHAPCAMRFPRRMVEFDPPSGKGTRAWRGSNAQ